MQGIIMGFTRVGVGALQSHFLVFERIIQILRVLNMNNYFHTYHCFGRGYRVPSEAHTINQIMGQHR